VTVAAGAVAVVGLARMQAQAANQLNRGVPTDGELHVLPVQGNVSMIVGDGGNIAMSIGNDGVLLVDSGLPENVDKLVALVRQVAPNKPIRLIINTNADKDHAFGNEKLGPMGRRIAGGNEGAGAGLGAQIIGHENVLDRLSAPVGQTSPMTPAGWPTDTYYTKKMEVYVNGESIIIENQPAAHTDGDSMVWFRKSDVVAAGDIYSTTTFPVIDLTRGGTVNGLIAGLNRLLDITVPQEKQEGGTYVIPGHGRLSDEADVVEYRDMATILRDRFVDLIKKGKTLQQLKDMKVVADYESRYGATTGPWTTDQFMEAMFTDLSKAAKAAPAAKAPAAKPAAPAKK
jgi:glyoxylase-like metal-dependent hydrolase (beta-lactamase superfamily II)